MCGSFCTFSKAFTQMQRLVDSGYDVIPKMSQNAFSTSTRFGKAEETVKRAEEITGKVVLHSVVQTEPIGPKKMCDLLVIAPCTGNTLAKLSLGITDTAVTMAAKSHLRILRPVLLCVATNDARCVGTEHRQTSQHEKHLLRSFKTGRLHQETKFACG